MRQCCVSARSRHHIDQQEGLVDKMTERQERSASLTSGTVRIARIRKIFLLMTSFTRFVLCIGAVSGTVVLRVAGVITIPWWIVVPAVLVGLALVVAFMSAVEAVGNAILDAGIKYLHNRDKNRK